MKSRPGKLLIGNGIIHHVHTRGRALGENPLDTHSNTHREFGDLKQDLERCGSRHGT